MQPDGRLEMVVHTAASGGGEGLREGLEVMDNGVFYSFLYHLQEVLIDTFLKAVLCMKQDYNELHTFLANGMTNGIQEDKQGGS